MQTPPVQQEQAPDDVQEEEEQPEVATPSLTAQIQQAQQKNEDIVGWLRIDDTEIDGAVVQGKDNEEYKRLNEWGEYSWTAASLPTMSATLTAVRSSQKHRHLRTQRPL